MADLAAQLIRREQAVLAHGSTGFNRSALMAGVILTKPGLSGANAVALFPARRPGAPFDEQFMAYLASLPPPA